MHKAKLIVSTADGEQLEKTVDVLFGTHNGVGWVAFTVGGVRFKIEDRHMRVMNQPTSLGSNNGCTEGKNVNLSKAPRDRR